MAKRKKILIKKIKGLELQEEKHLVKLKTLEGNKDTTPAYWKKEIDQYKTKGKITKKIK